MARRKNDGFQDEKKDIEILDKDKLQEILFGRKLKYSILDNDVEFFSTGSLVLDSLLGQGWSRGRIHLLKGRESVSKSRLMASVCFIETRFFNNTVLVIDYEGTWTESWLKSIFVDTRKVIIVRPEIAEESFDIVERAIETGKISSIIIDSIASMTTREEYEKSHEESTQASLARQLSKFCRKAVASLNNVRIQKIENNNIILPTIFLVNQVRTNLHARFNNETLPGGQAQKNTATTILDLFRTSNIENKDGDVVGFYIHARTDKNKLGVPFRTAQFGLISYEKGYLGHPRHAFYLGNEVFTLGLNFGLIKQSGSWYEILETGQKFQGGEEVIRSIVNDTNLSWFLIDKIKSKIKEEFNNDIEFNHHIFLKSLGIEK